MKNWQLLTPKPANRQTDDKYIKIKHAIESCDTCDQLHVALNMLNLYSETNPDKQDWKNLNHYFHLKAIDLGYYKWADK